MIRKIATFKMTSHSKLAMVFFVLLMLVAPAISAPIDFPAYVIPGSNWYVGTSTPTSSIGSSGDFYLQNSTGMIYQKIIGTWTAQGVLTSPTNESLFFYKPGIAGGQTAYGGNAANDDITISGTSSSTKTTSYVILQPDGGGVGVGISSPSRFFHIVNTSRAQFMLQGKSSSTTIQNGDISFMINNNDGTVNNWESVAFQQASSTVASLDVKNTNTSAHYGDFYFSTRYTDGYLGRLAILGDKTKIGATSLGATAQLHTTGDVRFAYYGAGTMNTDALGNIYVVSDEKYKTNIRKLAPSGTTHIKNIMSFSPAVYKFNSASGLDTQNDYVGYIAGQVKPFIPNAVKTKQDVKYEQKLVTKGKTSEEDVYETVEVPTGTTTDSLDDRAIIAELHLAMQEQQAQIEQLQAEVARLEGKKVDKV